MVEISSINYCSVHAQSLIGNIEILSVSDRVLHPQGNVVHDVDMMLSMIFCSF